MAATCLGRRRSCPRLAFLHTMRLTPSRIMALRGVVVVRVTSPGTAAPKAMMHTIILHKPLFIRPLGIRLLGSLFHSASIRRRHTQCHPFRASQGLIGVKMKSSHHTRLFLHDGHLSCIPQATGIHQPYRSAHRTASTDDDNHHHERLRNPSQSPRSVATAIT